MGKLLIKLVAGMRGGIFLTLTTQGSLNSGPYLSLAVRA